MLTRTLRTFAEFLIVPALLFALTSCGTSRSPIVCNPSNNATCVCGSGTQACPISPGPEFLYANSTTGQILAFSIDHNTGALTPLPSVAGPSMSFGLAAVNNQFLYASDASIALNSQLDGFSINQTTGALTPLADSPFLAGIIMQGLASPPGSSLLYGADAGAVDAFTVSTTGPPSTIPGPFPSGTNLFLTVDPSGKYLFTSLDNPPGGVFAFTIDSTGALTAVPNSPFTIPGQTVANSRPFGIVDTGSFVYTALSGTNQVAGFSIVSGTGALVPVPNSPFPAGTTPLSVVFTNGFLYANGDGTISGYSVDSASGMLTPLSDSPFAISGGSMAADSLGEYLYVSGAGGIQALKIDSNSGNLTPVNGSPFPASPALTMTVVQFPPP